MKLKMILHYLNYKRKGHIPVFGMGLIPKHDRLQVLTDDKEEYIMPNGRQGNCRFIICFKNDKGNIIHVVKDDDIFKNSYTEYFYVFYFYGYKDATPINKCSLKEFIYTYSSLFYPELDNDEHRVVNALIGYKPSIYAENIFGIWTKECMEKWGDPNVRFKNLP